MESQVKRENSGYVTHLKVNLDELLAINNALNEICYGFDLEKDSEFPARIGTDYQFTVQLLEEITEALDALESATTQTDIADDPLFEYYLKKLSQDPNLLSKIEVEDYSIEQPLNYHKTNNIAYAWRR